MIQDCSACGDKVSSEATICPHCGHPNKYEWKPVSGFFAVINTLIGFGLFFFVLIMIIIVIFS
jgi:hypothetical protein